MKLSSKVFRGVANKLLASIVIYGLAIFLVLLMGLAVVGLFITTHLLFCWMLICFILVLAFIKANWIAEELKKYFLWVAGNQTSGGLLSASVLATIILVFFLSAVFTFNVTPTSSRIIRHCSLAMLVIIEIVLPIINQIIVKQKITVLHLENNQIALVYYVDPTGKILFYKKPLWGKFPLSVIELPDGWMVGMEENAHKDFQEEIHFCLKDKTISNRPAWIPVMIKFSFSGPFKAQDFGNFVPNQLPSAIISLRDEIKKIFLESISLESRENLHADIADFFTHRISERALLYDILASIDFPKKLFSNAKKTTIRLEAPKFIFEKNI